MSLPIPTVGVASGPTWATLLDSCLTILDGHSHTPGSGVAITPGAMNINSDLTLANHSITSTKSVQFTAQGSPTASGSIYESGVDLYYVDGNGANIRLTQSGSIVGTAGSITGLPNGTASASYVSISGNFVWESATSTAANMDFGSAIMRNTSPNSTYALTLSPPAALGANYSLTLPALPATTRVLSVTSSGVIATGAAGAIVTADIGALQVTTAKIALANITTALIAAGNVTGSKIESFVDLPGTKSSVGSRNIVVSNANNNSGIVIARAVISAAGAILSGEGLICSLASAGVYNIGMIPTMGDQPAVSITVDGTGGMTYFTTGISTAGFAVTLLNSAGVPTSNTFSLIIIGQRA